MAIFVMHKFFLKMNVQINTQPQRVDIAELCAFDALSKLKEINLFFTVALDVCVSNSIAKYGTDADENGCRHLYNFVVANYPQFATHLRECIINETTFAKLSNGTK